LNEKGAASKIYFEAASLFYLIITNKFIAFLLGDLVPQIQTVDVFHFSQDH